jgi:hypothetical protein
VKVREKDIPTKKIKRKVFNIFFINFILKIYFCEIIYKFIKSQNLISKIMTKKQIFIISFYLIFGILLFLIGGIISILSAFVSISLYSVLFYGIYFFWKKFTKKIPLFYSDFAQIFLYKLSFFITLCF